MGNNLTVRELLQKTYEKLAERNQHEVIVLDNPVFAEIANDTDGYGSRAGGMIYEKVNLFKFNGKKWAVGNGKKSWGYPADPYDSDILALELEEMPDDMQTGLKEMIEHSTYFKNSLVYGMADGHLAVHKDSRLGEKMLGILKPKISEFITQNPEYNINHLSLSTLSPVNTKRMLYKSEFVDFLTEAIEKILEEVI